MHHYTIHSVVTTNAPTRTLWMVCDRARPTGQHRLELVDVLTGELVPLSTPTRMPEPGHMQQFLGTEHEPVIREIAAALRERYPRRVD